MRGKRAGAQCEGTPLSWTRNKTFLRRLPNVKRGEKWYFTHTMSKCARIIFIALVSENNFEVLWITLELKKKFLQDLKNCINKAKCQESKFCKFKKKKKKKSNITMLLTKHCYSLNERTFLVIWIQILFKMINKNWRQKQTIK